MALSERAWALTSLILSSAAGESLGGDLTRISCQCLGVLG